MAFPKKQDKAKGKSGKKPFPLKKKGAAPDYRGMKNGVKC